MSRIVLLLEEYSMKVLLDHLVPEYQKVSGARRMAMRLSRDGNRSRSFQALIEGIDRLSTNSPSLLAPR